MRALHSACVFTQHRKAMSRLTANATIGHHKASAIKLHHKGHSSGTRVCNYVLSFVPLRKNDESLKTFPSLNTAEVSLNAVAPL